MARKAKKSSKKKAAKKSSTRRTKSKGLIGRAVDTARKQARKLGL